MKSAAAIILLTAIAANAQPSVIAFDLTGTTSRDGRYTFEWDEDFGSWDFQIIGDSFGSIFNNPGNANGFIDAIDGELTFDGRLNGTTWEPFGTPAGSGGFSGSPMIDTVVLPELPAFICAMAVLVPLVGMRRAA